MMRAAFAILLLGFSVICCQMSAHENNDPDYPGRQTTDGSAGDYAMTDQGATVANLEETDWQLEEYFSEQGAIAISANILSAQTMRSS